MAIEVIKIPAQGKEDKVYEIRGKRVMIDRDLAECFGVETKYLNRVVKRNAEKFASDDYMLQLNHEECLRCQIVTLNTNQGQHLKYLPNAFTEEGVRALAQVLKRQVDVRFEPEITEPESIDESWNKGTVVLYRGENGTNLEVQVMDETVWLTQEQLSILLGSTPQNITTHIRNIYEEGELDFTATCKDYLQVRFEGSRSVSRTLKIYNLDVIISVGYRVKSVQGIRFRQWANRVLKDYLIKGYSINWRLQNLEDKYDKRFNAIENKLDEHQDKIDFFVRTNLPPVEGVVFDGQIFDAYDIACKIVRSARKRIILFDNYIDETVLTLLDKREERVSAVIYTNRITEQLRLDLSRHNAQYNEIELHEFKRSHDRFLCIDDTVYHIGASLKDLGKKWFAFNRMELKTDELLSHISQSQP